MKKEKKVVKLEVLRERHDREVRAMIRRALVAAGWTYRGASELLGCSTSGLQKMVERDVVLCKERSENAPRAGVGGRPAA